MVTDGRALAALALLGLLGAKAASGSRGIARAGRPSSPTAGFCTYCGRRPAGWDPKNPPKGFAIHRFPDPEDGPAEWRFQGEPVTCQTCQAQADAEEQAYFRGSRGVARSGRTAPERIAASVAFDVFLRGKRINTVFQKRRGNQTIQEMCEEIRRGLVDHDGYDSDIIVRKRRARAAPVGSSARSAPAWRTIAKTPTGFTGSPLPFVKGYVLEQRVDPDSTGRPGSGFGLYHVTTNLPAVLTEGRLRSRRELRTAGKQGAGLGGGFRDQAPDRVSVAVDLDQAERIHGAIRTMAEAVHGRIGGAEAFERMKGYSNQALDAIDRAMDFLLDGDEEDESYRWAKRVEDELVQAGQEARDATGHELYEALRRYETTIVDTVAEWTNEGWISDDELVCGTTVGFTEPAHKFARVRPEDVGLLRLAARRGVYVDLVVAECELRFYSDDLVITAVKQ